MLARQWGSFFFVCVCVFLLEPVCKNGQNFLSFTLLILSVKQHKKTLKYTKLKMNPSIFISVEIVILSSLIMLLQ